MTEDFDQRKTEFLAKYKELIDQYKVDWMSFPMFQPNEQGKWDVIINTQLADTSNQPVKSPFIP